MPETGFSSASDAAYDRALEAATNAPQAADTPAGVSIPPAPGGADAAPASAAKPALATSFDQFGLHPDILRAIADSGYTRPTPIQAEAIPVVLTGRDIMGAAQTGTGKTASFSLPIIQRLLPLASHSASPARHPVRALILTPTRELADQVAANVAAYAKHTALRSVVVFGGVDMNAQAAQLRRGVEVLIATPGRLLDHVQQRNTQLGQVQMLVLDEADRMLDMGFLPDLQRILDLLPQARQTLLFSATFSNEIKKLAATYLRTPLTIEVAQRNSTATNVRQILFEVDDADKPRAVTELIRRRGLKQVIVFCNSKLGASRLARQLERDGVVAAAIHGDKTQGERMQALDAFKRGEIVALVATDVAARGLDIAELPAVINYDLPFSAEDYVHRIGRTGRAGASGDALSLCAAKDVKLLADIEALIKRPLERETLALAPAVRERGDGRDPSRPSRERRFEAPSGGAHAARGTYAGSRGDAPRTSGAGGAARTGRPGEGRARYGAPAAPVDDIFTRPYEPSPSAQREAAAEATSGAPRRAPKRQVAALLGGMPRKTT